MGHSVRSRTTGRDEVCERILNVAEEHFRRVGHRKTSVADIASELGMSPANVYRFFPSKDAIKESVCMRVMDEVAAIAVVAARTRAPALEKLARLATAVHRHNKTRLVHERRMHDMVVAAMLEGWAHIKVHSARMAAIFERIIRVGRTVRLTSALGQTAQKWGPVGLTVEITALDPAVKNPKQTAYGNSDNHRADMPAVLSPLLRHSPGWRVGRQREPRMA
jgi:AcrR family transcriptional regulator